MICIRSYWEFKFYIVLSLKEIQQCKNKPVYGGKKYNDESKKEIQEYEQNRYDSATNTVPSEENLMLT